MSGSDRHRSWGVGGDRVGLVECWSGAEGMIGGRGLPESPCSVLSCVYAKSLQSCLTLRDAMDYKPTRFLWPRDSPGKNTRVGCHSLLQGIFSTQGSNSSLMSPALAPLAPPGKPLVLSWYTEKANWYPATQSHQSDLCSRFCVVR